MRGDDGTEDMGRRAASSCVMIYVVNRSKIFSGGSSALIASRWANASTAVGRDIGAVAVMESKKGVRKLMPGIWEVMTLS